MKLTQWLSGALVSVILILVPACSSGSRNTSTSSSTGGPSGGGTSQGAISSSDVLCPDSKTVFDEIAEVVRKHADWRLRVEGHADNFGGYSSCNLDISNRRAAAVKPALVPDYEIGAGRLTPAGIGASWLVTTNDTMEGRALNRRAELVRV